MITILFNSGRFVCSALTPSAGGDADIHPDSIYCQSDDGQGRSGG